MPSQGPRISPRPRARTPRTGTAALVLAGVLALLAVGAAAPADAAGSIRQAEWPLDQSHFQAQQVWRLSQGRGVTVAVVDTGVDSAHPDLKGRVLPGTSFLGDHGDGGTDTSSDSHGTAIAGIIAGTGKAEHGTGMTGLAPQARILPVRISLGSDVEAVTLAEGITYAADHHAQVINVSLGTATPDPQLRQAVDYALGKGAVLVASAGNDGQNGNPPQYPGAFPGVIDVTGVTETGAFWPVSESGPHSTLAAPATGVYSAGDRGQYVDAEGTSYAAAYVSAAAALVRSAHPELTAGQSIRRLITTAHRAAGQPAHSDQFGYGSLDPLAALRAPASVDGPPANPLLSAPATGGAAHHHSRGWAGPALTAGLAVAAAAVITVIVLRRRRRPAPAGTGPARAQGAKRPTRPQAGAARKGRSGAATGGGAARTPRQTAQPGRKRGASKTARR